MPLQLHVASPEASAEYCAVLHREAERAQRAGRGRAEEVLEQRVNTLATTTNACVRTAAIPTERLVREVEVREGWGVELEAVEGAGGDGGVEVRCRRPGVGRGDSGEGAGLAGGEA